MSIEQSTLYKFQRVVSKRIKNFQRILQSKSFLKFIIIHTMGMASFAVALVVIMVIISPSVYGKEYSDQQKIKVEKLLKRLNKPPLISIKVFYIFKQLGVLKKKNKLLGVMRGNINLKVEKLDIVVLYIGIALQVIFPTLVYKTILNTYYHPVLRNKVYI